MACLRYDPKTRTFFPIKYSQMNKRDTGENLSFRDQILRGYKRQEAKGGLGGRRSGIKKIWDSN